MATLYEIRQEIEGFAFDVDEETGEFLNATEWEALNMAYEEKVENTACLIKNLRSDVTAFKAEEAELAERRKKAEKRIEYLENLLLANMGGQKYSGIRCEVKFSKSKRVEIVDEKAVPKDFLIAKTEYKPDKTAIKKALESGTKVQGCTIMQCTNINVK